MIRSCLLLACLATVTLGTQLHPKSKPVIGSKNFNAKIQGPITDHFKSWLNANGYGNDNFEYANYGTQGSFGGKQSDSDKVNNVPVIFIHGNSDAALRTSDSMSGWEFSIDYFQQRGYTSAELYATSWGDDIALEAATRTHSCKETLRLRRFVQAVKAYTGASMVSIVTHSMGVTLGRKLIKGGQIDGGLEGSCNLGNPLSFVDVFIGLSGGNYGLCNCEGFSTLSPTCNSKNGLWPGDSCGLNYLDCGLTILPFPCNGPTYSSFLTDLNNDVTLEAKRVVSGWSSGDDLIMYGNMVWGRPTSLIPRSTDQKTYLTYTHMETKERTADDQYNWVTRKN